MRPVRAPDRPGTDRLAHHVKSRGVIDLAVDQDDRRDGRIANRSIRLQFRRRLQLCQYVGRGIDQYRLGAGPSDGNRRLSPGASLQGTGAQSSTIAAITVPLRESAAGGRPQYSDLHVKLGAPARAGWRPFDSAVGDVHRDFHAEAQIDGLRGFPCHIESPLGCYRPILCCCSVPRISSIMKLGS
jgi:hypothetical protein